MTRRAAGRITGAALVSSGALALLLRGGAGVGPAALVTIAAACFMLWRTIAGALSAFSLLAAAALLSAPSRDLAWATALDRPALGLALLAIGSLAVTAAVSERGWPSRRLVGAVLAAGGLLLTGLVLASAARTVAIGSAMVAGALAYWMGAVPAFAWAPLLLRHERGAVAALGVAAWLATAVVLWWTVPLLPTPRAARTTLLILGAVTLPWGAWQAWRQRRTDPRCARSFLLVAAGSVLALVRAAVS